MKKMIAAISVFLFISGLSALALGPDELTFQIKKLYSAPSLESKCVYEIPIDVQLLEVSADANWYKVQIGFNIGPARFNYAGWTQIPIGEIVTKGNSHSTFEAEASE